MAIKFQPDVVHNEKDNYILMTKENKKNHTTDVIVKSNKTAWEQVSNFVGRFICCFPGCSYKTSKIWDAIHNTTDAEKAQVSPEDRAAIGEWMKKRLTEDQKSGHVKKRHDPEILTKILDGVSGGEQEDLSRVQERIDSLAQNLFSPASASPSTPQKAQFNEPLAENNQQLAEILNRFHLASYILGPMDPVDASILSKEYLELHQEAINYLNTQTKEPNPISWFITDQGVVGIAAPRAGTTMAQIKQEVKNQLRPILDVDVDFRASEDGQNVPLIYVKNADVIRLGRQTERGKEIQFHNRLNPKYLEDQADAIKYLNTNRKMDEDFESFQWTATKDGSIRFECVLRENKSETEETLLVQTKGRNFIEDLLYKEEGIDSIQMHSRKNPEGKTVFSGTLSDPNVIRSLAAKGRGQAQLASPDLQNLRVLPPLPRVVPLSFSPGAAQADRERIAISFEDLKKFEDKAKQQAAVSYLNATMHPLYRWKAEEDGSLSFLGAVSGGASGLEDRVTEDIRRKIKSPITLQFQDLIEGPNGNVNIATGRLKDPGTITYLAQLAANQVKKENVVKELVFQGKHNLICMLNARVSIQIQIDEQTTVGTLRLAIRAQKDVPFVAFALGDIWITEDYDAVPLSRIKSEGGQDILSAQLFVYV